MTCTGSNLWSCPSSLHSPRRQKKNAWSQVTRGLATLTLSIELSTSIYSISKSKDVRATAAEVYVKISKSLILCWRLFPRFHQRGRPRDKPNSIENIDQSAISFRLLRRELHKYRCPQLSTSKLQNPCLSPLCFPFTLAKWITKMPNKAKKEKVMYRMLWVSFILVVYTSNVCMNINLAIMTDRLFDVLS